MNYLIDAFYQFKKVEGKKTVFLCTKSTGNYEPFESRRNKKGVLTANLTDADFTKEIFKRKEKWKMSVRNFHISKLRAFKDSPKKAFGDTQGTKDCLFFLLDESLESFKILNVFIAKGKKNDYPFISMYLDDEFKEEFSDLATKAIS